MHLSLLGHAEYATWPAHLAAGNPCGLVVSTELSLGWSSGSRGVVFDFVSAGDTCVRMRAEMVALDGKLWCVRSELDAIARLGRERVGVG